MFSLIVPTPLVTPSGRHCPHADPETDDRFLSRAQCRALADRILALTTGGGRTRTGIYSVWTDSLRWARNVINVGGDTRITNIDVTRIIRRAVGRAVTNSMTVDALRSCVQRAEDFVLFNQENPDDYPEPIPPVRPHANPTLWFARTVMDDDADRAAAIDAMIAPTEAAGALSAGYLEVAARGMSLLDTDGLTRYYPYSTAQCSVTVRDPQGMGSGWAGVDWNDVARIDTARLAHIALDKCQRSRNPVAIEPGRYTAILEPQAVCDLVAPLMERALDRLPAERGQGPFADPSRPGWSRLGQRVVDSRLTLSADPMDPDCGFVPFDGGGEPYPAIKWIENGVLRALSYDRGYGVRQLGQDAALPNSRAFRLSGMANTSTIEEMIAGTTRGILVTRFNNVQLLDFDSMLMNGNTRDGLWLIERGKITKAIKNFRFTESPIFVLNNLDAIGIPQRVFRPSAPAVVPPLMVRDFSFTALIDAV